MTAGRIGIAIQERDAAAALAAIERAERRGIPAAWMTTGGTGMDALTLFGAAAARTRRILLGTAIVPTFPRHPIVAAQQAQVIAGLAPGRLRLGVGPSHGPTMSGIYGLDFHAPLQELREYLIVLKGLLQQGEIDIDGERFRVHARLTQPLDLPVMASALQQRSFELCGELSDGAITWLCPAAYIHAVGLPALQRGAQKASRPAPPIVAHAPVCVSTDATAVREAARTQLAGYARLPFYARMLTAAGFPGAQEKGWSDAAIDAVVLHGDEERVAARLRELLEAGAAEIIAAPLAVGPDSQVSLKRTLDLIARLAR